MNLILSQIGDELTKQISLTKNTNGKIELNKLIQQSKSLNDIITSSKISDESKSMLQKFSSTLSQGNATVKDLRYEKQDLERVLTNLNDL